MNYKRPTASPTYKCDRAIGYRTDFLTVGSTAGAALCKKTDTRYIEPAQIRETLSQLHNTATGAFAVNVLSNYIQQNPYATISEMRFEDFVVFTDYLQVLQTQKLVLLSFCILMQTDLNSNFQAYLCRSSFFDWINRLISSGIAEIQIYAIFIAAYSTERSMDVRDAIMKNGILNTVFNLQCETEDQFRAKCRFFVLSSKYDFGSNRGEYDRIALHFAQDNVFVTDPWVAMYSGLKVLLHLFSKSYDIYNILFDWSLINLASNGMVSKKKKIRNVCSSYLVQIVQTPDFPFNELLKYGVLTNILNSFKWDDSKLICSSISIIKEWIVNGNQYVHNLVLELDKKEFWQYLESCKFECKVLTIPMFCFFAKFTTQSDALLIFQYPILQLIIECIGYNVKTSVDVAEIIIILIPKVLSQDFNRDLINLLNESNVMDYYEEITNEISDEEMLNTICLFRDYLSLMI